MSEQEVEALRELLRGAKCACGHDAEWHSGMLGCNAEDFTAEGKPCECDEDWVGAVAPILATRAEAALASAKAEALEAVRLVERDMAEQALAAWRSANARRGLSDHAALEVHADALTRWSERLRMAMNGEDYRSDREATQ